MTDKELPPLPDPHLDVMRPGTKWYTADQMRAYARETLAHLAAMCQCKDRPAADCPGEWEPGCDLGANPAHVRVAQPAASGELLTDEQIDQITAEQWGKGLGAPYAAYRAYARAIEAACGITAKEAP